MSPFRSPSPSPGPPSPTSSTSTNPLLSATSSSTKLASLPSSASAPAEQHELSAATDDEDGVGGSTSDWSSPSSGDETSSGDEDGDGVASSGEEDGFDMLASTEGLFPPRSEASAASSNSAVSAGESNAGAGTRMRLSFPDPMSSAEQLPSSPASASPSTASREKGGMESSIPSLQSLEGDGEGEEGYSMLLDAPSSAATAPKAEPDATEEQKKVEEELVAEEEVVEQQEEEKQEVEQQQEHQPQKDESPSLSRADEVGEWVRSTRRASGTIDSLSPSPESRTVSPSPAPTAATPIPAAEPVSPSAKSPAASTLFLDSVTSSQSTVVPLRASVVRARSGGEEGAEEEEIEKAKVEAKDEKKVEEEVEPKNPVSPVPPARTWRNSSASASTRTLLAVAAILALFAAKQGLPTGGLLTRAGEIFRSSAPSTMPMPVAEQQRALAVISQPTVGGVQLELATAQQGEQEETGVAKVDLLTNAPTLPPSVSSSLTIAATDRPMATPVELHTSSAVLTAVVETAAPEVLSLTPPAAPEKPQQSQLDEQPPPDEVPRPRQAVLQQHKAATLFGSFSERKLTRNPKSGKARGRRYTLPVVPADAEPHFRARTRFRERHGDRCRRRVPLPRLDGGAQNVFTPPPSALSPAEATADALQRTLSTLSSLASETSRRLARRAQTLTSTLSRLNFDIPAAGEKLGRQQKQGLKHAHKAAQRLSRALTDEIRRAGPAVEAHLASASRTVHALSSELERSLGKGRVVVETETETAKVATKADKHLRRAARTVRWWQRVGVVKSVEQVREKYEVKRKRREERRARKRERR